MKIAFWLWERMILTSQIGHNSWACQARGPQEERPGRKVRHTLDVELKTQNNHQQGWQFLLSFLFPLIHSVALELERPTHSSLTGQVVTLPWTVQGRMWPWPWNHFKELSTITSRGFQYKWETFLNGILFHNQIFWKTKTRSDSRQSCRGVQLKKKVWKKKKYLQQENSA